MRGKDEENEAYIITVKLREHVEGFMPKDGGRCRLKLVDPVTKKASSVMWSAERIANPFGLFGKGHQALDGHAMFKVDAAVSEDGTNVPKPLLPRGQDIRQVTELLLDSGNAVGVAFHFEASDVTAEAELTALEKLNRADPEQVHPDQLRVFNYVMDFKEPVTKVSLFASYPRMADPEKHAAIIKPAILHRYTRMNEHQKKAYHELLSNLPAGIGFLPGGPGAGKTSWALAVMGILQSVSRAKVLYILDINKPLDDTIVKYTTMWKKAGVTKKAIRVRGFGNELKNSSHFGSMQKKAKLRKGIEDEEDSDAQAASDRFFAEFMALYRCGGAATPKSEETVNFLSLDEAAWKHYEENHGKYDQLTEALEISRGNPLESRTLKGLIFRLYEDVLREADFIATTPVVAATYFSRMFKPDLVFIDEAAHARELSTLIPIANFNAKAIIQIGDFRQTLPFVRDADENNYAPQLLISMMERAFREGAIGHQLLINHRAYAELELLPSMLIYDGKMVSGIRAEDKYPPSVRHVLQWMSSKLLKGEPCLVPRVIVSIGNCGIPTRVGTSWYHATHTSWVMKRVLELGSDDEF